jgi:hypothetical protein
VKKQLWGRASWPYRHSALLGPSPFGSPEFYLLSTHTEFLVSTLTLWNRTVLEKLTVIHLLKKLPALYGTHWSQSSASWNLSTPKHSLHFTTGYNRSAPNYICVPQVASSLHVSRLKICMHFCFLYSANNCLCHYCLQLGILQFVDVSMGLPEFYFAGSRVLSVQNIGKKVSLYAPHRQKCLCSQLRKERCWNFQFSVSALIFRLGLHK